DALHTCTRTAYSPTANPVPSAMPPELVSVCAGGNSPEKISEKNALLPLPFVLSAPARPDQTQSRAFSVSHRPWLPATTRINGGAVEVLSVSVLPVATSLTLQIVMPLELRLVKVHPVTLIV